jgi:hypothetical protein
MLGVEFDRRARVADTLILKLNTEHCALHADIEAHKHQDYAFRELLEKYVNDQNGLDTSESIRSSSSEMLCYLTGTMLITVFGAILG